MSAPIHMRSLILSRDILNSTLSREIRANMSVFISRCSQTTGELEWIVQDEDYDYQQEVARSAYADMLHDKERNQKYYAGLKESISYLHSQKKKAHVLDIGTGTGLLSMMAASCDADSVTACEAFVPVANMAKQIIKKNGFADKITLISKRSTELTVGTNGDMKRKANILVTEVFDTELIGEGALFTFKHALDHLLEEDCIVIPTFATVYVQVVQSELVSHWYRQEPIEIPGKGKLIPPDHIVKCPGRSTANDLQMTELPVKQFQVLTEPVPIFKFDFSKQNGFKFNEENVKEVKLINSGTAQAIFMWWELQMTPSGKIHLSCAPHWAHPQPLNMQWRDHWMQAVYNLPEPIEVREGQLINVTGHHDEYEFWFSVKNQSRFISSQSSLAISKADCNCDLHRVCIFNRLGQLNNKNRNDIYIAALKKLIDADSVCLCISDCSLLSLIAAKLGAKQIYTLESNHLARRVVKSYIKHNCLEEKVTVWDKIPANLNEGLQINLVFGEPYFVTTTLPWNNLMFWYTKEKAASLLSTNVKVSPYLAVLKGIAVELMDLWKIRAPVGTVEGFDLGLFDNLISIASRISDSPVEAHPLWEYPCTALTLPFEILQFDLTNSLFDSLEYNGIVKFESLGKCNAVAVWMEWWLTDEHCVSTGTVGHVVPGDRVSWDMDYKQGIIFIKDVQCINEEKSLKYTASFKPKSGNLDLKFNIS